MRKSSGDSVISRFREIFWPIYGQENWKFIPMLVMMTLALFVYTTLRIHKDAYILSAPLSSANTISFLKAYLVLPFSFLYMMGFYALVHKFSKEKVFLIALVPFFLFFLLFYTVLLPNIAYFHISVENVAYFQQKFPSFKNFVPVLAYWIFSLYYVFSELWGTVVISFLFWGFANYAVTLEQTKRFYALFASYSYIGLIIAAKTQSYLYTFTIAYEKNSLEYFNIIFFNCYLVLFSIAGFIFLYWFVNNCVLPHEKNGLFNKMTMAPKSKFKPTLKESLQTIMNSKYLLYIALIVISYGLTANLLEVTWKELVRRELMGVEAEIGKYMSDFYFATGVCTIFLGLLNKQMIQKFGWRASSLLAPTFLMISAILFFFLVLWGDKFLSLQSYSACYLAMQVGFIQDIFIKASKYGILDPNLQATYLPLEDELKTKGKAAVDIVGSKLGKSSASFLESYLSVLFGGADQLELSGIFMPIVLLVGGVWIWATLALAFSYNELIEKKAK